MVRTGLNFGMKVYGVMRGYNGLLTGDLKEMNMRSVSDIMQHGGTALYTARSPEFNTPAGVEKAANMCREKGIEGVVVIGGDGSFRGAKELHDRGIHVVGVPGTIDNDMAGTDCTIGFDTACNTALECISKLRDTASSHDRMFIVEVMGRHAGFLALETGVACGAEFVLIPELPVDLEAIANKIHYAKQRGKTHSLIVLAEGVMSASELAEKLKGHCDYDPRIVVLGHLQRGGAPSCFDTVLASRLGAAAVEALIDGKRGMMVGRTKDEIVTVPLEMAWTQHHPLDSDMLRLVETLSI